MGSLKVIENTKDRLVISRSRIGATFTVVYYVGFHCVWYYAVLHKYLPDHSIFESLRLLVSENKLMLIFIIAPLFSVQLLYTACRNAWLGEDFLFLKKQERVIRNGALYSKFADIQSLQIREIKDSDDDATFRMSFLMTDGSKKFIESSKDRDYVYALADDIVHIIEIPIIYK